MAPTITPLTTPPNMKAPTVSMYDNGDTNMPSMEFSHFIMNNDVELFVKALVMTPIMIKPGA